MLPIEVYIRPQHKGRGIALLKSDGGGSSTSSNSMAILMESIPGTNTCTVSIRSRSIIDLKGFNKVSKNVAGLLGILQLNDGE